VHAWEDGLGCDERVAPLAVLLPHGIAVNCLAELLLQVSMGIEDVGGTNARGPYGQG
jgi:hypothetical protein